MVRRGVVLAALLWTSTARAGIGDNLFGARVVQGPQLTLEVGFPDVELGVRVPVARTVDVRPRARFSWARGTAIGALEGSIGVDFRVTLLDQGRLTAGLLGSVPIHLAVVPGGGVVPGIGLLWPGLTLTWEVEGVVDVDLGVQLQDDLYIVPGGPVLFSGRVPLRAGFGYELATGVQLGLLIEGGPAFGATVNAPARPGNVGAYLRVVAGLGYTF